NHVAAADLDRPEAGGAAGGVHQALDDVGRLGPSGAAIGVDGDGVGEDALHFVVRGRDRVDAGLHALAGQGRDVGSELREIGAQIGGRLDANGKDAAVAIERELGARDVVAAVCVRN